MTPRAASPKVRDVSLPAATLLRLGAIFVALAVACVGPRREATRSGGGGLHFSAAKADTQLVFAAPERGAPMALLLKAAPDRPVWLDRTLFSSSLRHRSRIGRLASQRVDRGIFRALSLVGTVELRI